MASELFNDWKGLLEQKDQDKLVERLSLEGFNSNAIEFESNHNISFESLPKVQESAYFLYEHESKKFNFDMAHELGIKKIFIEGDSVKNSMGINIISPEEIKSNEIEDNTYLDVHFLSFNNIDQELSKLTDKSYNICINLSRVHNAGASIAQELTYLLSFLDKIYSSRFKVHNLLVTVPADSLYFANIAKFRSVRYLIEKMNKVHTQECEFEILGISSLRDQTLYDPRVNMLRNTTSAMSQLIGKADYVSTMSFDGLFSILTKSEIKDSSYRETFNTLNVLKEESHLDFNNDLASGSFSIENLTTSIIKSCWDSFLQWNQRDFFEEIDQFTESVSAISKIRSEHIHTRKKVITGISKFSNPEDSIKSLYDRDWTPIEFSKGKFPLRRNAYSFEKLKLETEKQKKKIKGVIYFKESLKKINPRINFIKDVLDIIHLDYTQQSLNSFNDIEDDETNDFIILCTSENDYSQYQSIIDNHSAFTVCTGKPPAETENTHLYHGLDIYKFLKNLVTRGGLNCDF